MVYLLLEGLVAQIAEHPGGMAELCRVSASQRSTVQDSRSFNTWATRPNRTSSSRAQRGEFGGIARVTALRVGGAVVEQRDCAVTYFIAAATAWGCEHRFLAGSLDRFAGEFIEAGDADPGAIEPAMRAVLAIIESTALAAGIGSFAATSRCCT